VVEHAKTQKREEDFQYEAIHGRISSTGISPVTAAVIKAERRSRRRASVFSTSLATA
jgi:hypothetical protein